MTIHIGASVGEISERVLLPGDPMRAKYIAENMLSNAKCYNEVRGMYGFTGEYKGKVVSVQGTGMGMPSMSIYANELISQFNVKKLIRIGTCGSINENVKVREIILASGASTNSSINSIRFNGASYAPIADFMLLRDCVGIAESRNIRFHIGNVLTSDLFYNDDDNWWRVWSDYGVLGAEMETAELYTLGGKYGVQTLSILTVSDSMFEDTISTSEEREKTFLNMAEIALDTI